MDGRADRTKTVTGSAPADSSRDVHAVSGLEYLQTIQTGKIPPPPAANLIGYRLVDIQYGDAIFGLIPLECHYNPFSTIHGGILAVLLDTAMAAAVLSTLAAGWTCVTSHLTITYNLPVTTKSGELLCRAKQIHAARKVGAAEGDITDRKKKLIARGTATCSIIKLEKR